MKLLIHEKNREVVRLLAASMSDSSLTSALNYILEAAGWTVLERYEKTKEPNSSDADVRRTDTDLLSPIVERSAPVQALDRSAIDSAFD